MRWLGGLLLILAACGGEAAPTSTSVPSVVPVLAPLTDGERFGGEAVPDRFGNPGGAIRLDGLDDYIEVPHSAAISMSGNFTVAAWIWFEEQDSNAEWYTVFEKSDPERGGHSRYGVWILDDTLALCIERSDHASQECVEADVSIPHGAWHHIAAVRDGNRAQFYLDGVDAGSGLVGASPIAESEFSAFVGTDVYGPPLFLRATLDELFIYDVGLSTEAVAQLAGD